MRQILDRLFVALLDAPWPIGFGLIFGTVFAFGFIAGRIS